MIETIGRRLRLAFGSTEQDPAVPADLPPVVEFVAYADDCVISGHVPLVAERLTDLLNDHEEFQLIDVLVAPLDGTPETPRADILVRRDDLLLVHASGPRGGPDRRRRTLTHDLIISSGPYQVRGSLHALPGADPLEALRRRPAMVPLTDVWIDYVANGVRQEQRFDAVVVNRERVDWVTSVAATQAEGEEAMKAAIASISEGPIGG